MFNKPKRLFLNAIILSGHTSADPNPEYLPSSKLESEPGKADPRIFAVHAAACFLLSNMLLCNCGKSPTRFRAANCSFQKDQSVVKGTDEVKR